jgi:twitching motility protein PilI
MDRMQPSGVISSADPATPVPVALAALPRMGIRIGQLRLLLPADGAREVITPPPISRVPHTVPWLLGLANVRGGLVPVVDAAAALGETRRGEEPPYLLISGQGDGTLGLLIDGLPRLLNVDPAQQAERPAVSSLLEPNIVAAYRHDRGLWLDVDLERLFDTFARHATV